MNRLSDLADMSWPEVDDEAAGAVLVVPLGATEQHGPHLPLSTDSDIAGALARALAEKRPDVLVAPTLPYGSSGEHAGFAGTLSIGADALEAVLVELGRSADAFAGVIFVSAHGGNASAVARAVRRLVAEGRRVTSWSPVPPRPDPTGRFDAHAGYGETSVLLALCPERVRTDRAEAGNTADLASLMPALRRDGVAGVSTNGVLGDPSGADAGAGESLLSHWAADLNRAVEDWP